MSGISWARHFVTGLLGKARALFHGLGRPGEYPSRFADQPVRCEVCRFWGAERYLGMPEPCLRRAPGIGRDLGGLKAAEWPHTKATDWCGDFERR